MNKLKLFLLDMDGTLYLENQLFEGVLELDEKGYIKTDSNMRTSCEKVFAIGDVRNGFLKQIVTACADGAIAGQLC